MGRGGGRRDRSVNRAGKAIRPRCVPAPPFEGPLARADPGHARCHPGPDRELRRRSDSPPPCSLSAPPTAEPRLVPGRPAGPRSTTRTRRATRFAPAVLCLCAAPQPDLPPFGTARASLGPERERAPASDSAPQCSRFTPVTARTVLKRDGGHSGPTAVNTPKTSPPPRFERAAFRLGPPPITLWQGLPATRAAAPAEAGARCLSPPDREGRGRRGGLRRRG